MCDTSAGSLEKLFDSTFTPVARILPITHKTTIHLLSYTISGYSSQYHCVIFILCRTAAEVELWTPFNVIRSAYNFQAQESSAFIQVSMLLAAAYGPMGLIIEPDVALNLPIVKKTRSPICS